ncbi:MAG: MFS transporter, partial [Clostridia bacterium]|nr:MFS transporter [Clostridia bacterium]
WSMLPSLTSHHEDRDKLSSIANICAGVGAGLATILVPTLTTGSMTIGGSATTAFPVLAIVIGAIFIGCQLMTCICVKEKPLPPLDANRPKVNPLKQIFKVLKGNDQLRWTAIIMFIHNLGSSILGGLSTWYVYFRFGYEGAMVSLFGILTGIAGAILIIYPLLAKRFNRRQISKICLILIYVGYGVMLILGLATQNVQSNWVFYPIALSGAFWAIGQAVFYQVQTITIANSVEYNEWKHGEREEGIIFSIRPLAAKMGSAAQMGVVTVILSILGIADITDKISEQENLVNMGQITAEAKLANIEAIIAQVPQSTVNWLLVCMTVLPMIIMTITVILYLKKSTLDEEMYERMRADIEARKAGQVEEAVATEEVTAE